MACSCLGRERDQLSQPDPAKSRPDGFDMGSNRWITSLVTPSVAPSGTKALWLNVSTDAGLKRHHCLGRQRRVIHIPQAVHMS